MLAESPGWLRLILDEFGIIIDVIEIKLGPNAGVECWRLGTRLLTSDIGVRSLPSGVYTPCDAARQRAVEAVDRTFQRDPLVALVGHLAGSEAGPDELVEA